MNAQDLILRIIQLKPNLTRFHIAKLSYLYDLACVQIFGKPRSRLPFEWHHHGPYCREIENATWRLDEEAKIAVKPHITKTGHDCYLHLPLIAEVPESEELDEKILQYLVKRFGNLSTEDLKKFVYSTAPMLDAQRKKARFKKLNLKSKTNLPKELFDRDTVMMILNSKLSALEDRIPLSDYKRAREEQKKAKSA